MRPPLRSTPFDHPTLFTEHQVSMAFSEVDLLGRPQAVL
jgi:hypothetical protein